MAGFKDWYLMANGPTKWKILSDISKQAQEVIFSRKTNKINHPTITFNTVPVACAACQKHIGCILMKN